MSSHEFEPEPMPEERNPYAALGEPVSRRGRVGATSIACLQCGYDLSGATVGSLCPECGASVVSSLQPRLTSGDKASGASIACLVCGIIGIVACPLTGVVSIVLYLQVMGDIRAGRSGPASKPLAIAGLVMGILSLGIMAFAVLVMIASTI